MRKIDSIIALNTRLELLEGSKFSTNAYFFHDELISLINSKSLYFQSFGTNLLIYKYVKELGFFEVYYYIKDIVFPIDIVDNEVFVMEIPYRGIRNFPSEIVEFWQKSGFVAHINRDLFGLVRPDTSEFVLPNPEFEYTFVDNLNSVDLIFESIKNTFDKFTGDILTRDEVVSALNNNEIVGAYKNAKLAGFIRFYAKNKVSWIGHLVVLPSYMGKGIGKSLVAHYLKIRSEQGFTIFQQWVVSDNTAALKLYSYFGFKSTNKSSISLLKNKK